MNDPTTLNSQQIVREVLHYKNHAARLAHQRYVDMMEESGNAEAVDMAFKQPWTIPGVHLKKVPIYRGTDSRTLRRLRAKY